MIQRQIATTSFSYQHMFFTDDREAFLRHVHSMSRENLGYDVGIRRDSMSQHEFHERRLGKYSDDDSITSLTEFSVQKHTSRHTVSGRLGRLSCDTAVSPILVGVRILSPELWLSLRIVSLRGTLQLTPLSPSNPWLMFSLSFAIPMTHRNSPLSTTAVVFVDIPQLIGKSLSFPLSVSLSLLLCLSVCLCLCLSLCLGLSVSLSRSLCLSLPLPPSLCMEI